VARVICPLTHESELENMYQLFHRELMGITFPSRSTGTLAMMDLNLDHACLVSYVTAKPKL